MYSSSPWNGEHLWNIDICLWLSDEICDKLNIKNWSEEFNFLQKTFDYIKKIPERNPKMKKRKNWEDYIVHLVETARILLEISNNLSFKQVIVALLHDSIEDIIEENDVVEEELKNLFWEDIAKSVRKLSKDDLPKNLEEEHREHLKRIRNAKYCENLENLDDFELNVKFADKIHNLRTLYWLEKKFIERYFHDACKYYLPLAQKRNKKAANLMFEELVKIYKYLHEDKIDNILNAEVEKRVILEEII